MELLNNNKRNFVPKSDLEEIQSTENPSCSGDNAAIEEAVTNIGSALAQVSQLLEELENDGMLGSAIRRFAADLADSVGNVARDLDNGQDHQDKKQMWARALLQDAKDQLLLENELNVSSSSIVRDDHHAGNQMINGGMTAARAISELSENDLVEAMNATRTILLDIEDALRNISEDDAEEIAEVGLAVAKIFLWGLQNIHSQIAPNILKNGAINQQFINGETCVDFEILNERPEGMDYETYREKRTYMNKVLKWFTK